MTAAVVPAAARADAADREAPGRGGLPAEQRFRPDIETLRAFAVGSVLVYHLNSRWLPGGFVGVDVFFVISGFLITSHLVGELDRTGTVALRRFYGRRILRLIPASTVVLLATAVGVALVVPRFSWRQFGGDGVAASTYALNWVLAARSVDYLAEDSLPSPWQHYWSLAVEEQFYLAWPLLMILLALLARRRSGSVRRHLVVAAAVVAVLSLAAAVHRTAVGEPSAYFTTTTRLWELALGALAALTIERVRRSTGPRLRSLLVALGLGCLLASVLLLDGGGWPGWPALLPTGGAALVVLGGGRDTWAPLLRLLSLRWVVWVGGVSYALYLWHWPLVTLAHYHWATFGPQAYAVVLASTFGLAWASQRLVENPVRFSTALRAHWWRPFVLGGACMLVGVAACLALLTGAPSGTLAAPPGAHARGAGVLPARIDLARHPAWSQGVRWVTPSPLAALDDVPRAYADGCQQSTTDSAPRSCSYGDPAGTRTVVLVGDSKALQWLPALDVWAQGRRLRLVTYSKSSCPFADAPVELDGSDYPSCRAWYGAVLQQVTALRPALVVTSQVRGDARVTGQVGTTPAALMADGLERTWSALTRQGIPVAVVADTPQPGTNVYACVAEHPDDLDRCAYDRARAVAASAAPTQLAAVRALGGGSVSASAVARPGADRRLWLVDLTDAVCPDARRCPPVVGNVLIYRSGSHITKTYVLSLDARLGKILDRDVLAH